MTIILRLEEVRKSEEAVAARQKMLLREALGVLAIGPLLKLKTCLIGLHRVH